MVKLEGAEPSENLINKCLYGSYGKPLVSPPVPSEPEPLKPGATKTEEEDYWEKKERYYADLKRWERDLKPYYENEPIVTFDDDRAKACQQLALMCKEKMDKELNENEKDEFRKSLIDEIKISHIPTGDYVDVLGKKTQLYNRENTILDEGFDTEEYIAKKKKEPFGFCALALYGMEWQFLSQMKYPLQDTSHAAIANNVDALIFGKKVTVKEEGKEDARSVRNRAIKWLNSPRNEIDKRLILKERGLDVDNEAQLKGITVDKYLTHLNDYLSIPNISSVLDSVISRGIIEPEPQIIIEHRYNSKEKIAEKCNDLYLNPILEKNKYRYCTEVDLDGNQTARMYRAVTTPHDKGFEKDWTKILKDQTTSELAFMWRRLNPTFKKELMNKFNINQPIDTDYNNFNSLDQGKVIKAWVSLEDRKTPTGGLSEAEKLNIIHKKQLDNIDNTEKRTYITDDSMKQECYHLFWNLLFHSDMVNSYYEAIKAARDRGELTNAEYSEMINSLRQEEMAIEELEVLYKNKDIPFTEYMREKKEILKRQAKLAQIAKKIGKSVLRSDVLKPIAVSPEGNEPDEAHKQQGFTPKVTYMPIRNRIHLSQANMDKLLQYNALFRSIEGLSKDIGSRKVMSDVLSGGDPRFYELYKNTFSQEEWEQLNAPKSGDLASKGEGPEKYLSEEEED